MLSCVKSSHDGVLFVCLIDYLKLNCISVLYCLDVYEQLKTQLWEDDAVTGLFFIGVA